MSYFLRFRVHAALLLVWILLFGTQAYAQAFRGGDLTYRCLGGSGQFEFTAGVYVTCPDTVTIGGTLRVRPFRDSLVLYQTYRTPWSDTIIWKGWLRFQPVECYSIADSSFPRITPIPAGNCNSPGSVIKNVWRLVFRGVIDLDPVAVPASGYTFFVPHASEARSVVGGIPGGLLSRGLFAVDPADNLNTGAVGPVARLAVKMFGFAGLRPQFICDTTPVFYNDPNSMFIANPNTFVLDSVTVANFAVEGNFYDSVSYHLGGPIYDTAAPRSSAYDASAAFNSSASPSGLFNLNPLTGEFSFKPLLRFGGQTASRYHWGITVRSWRCNSLLSEVYREFVTDVIQRPTSGRIPPFLENQKPPYFASNTRFLREYYVEDTVNQNLLIGDDVPFGLPPGTDNYLSIGIKSPFMTLATASGTGTPSPAVSSTTVTIPFPAGRTDLPSDQIAPNGMSIGYGYSAINSTSLRLGWVSRCDTVFRNACYNHSRLIPFLVTAADVTPPLFGKQPRIFNVRMRNLPALPEPEFVAVSVGDENDRVRLYFKSRIDTVTVDPLDSLNNILDGRGLNAAQLKAKSVNRRLNSFKSYQVYRSEFPTGPWVSVPNGSITDPFANTFEDNDPALRLRDRDYYYKILTLSGCPINLRFSESIVIKTLGGNYTNDKPNLRGVLVWDTMGIANQQYLLDTTQIQERWPTAFAWDSLKVVSGIPRIDSTLPFLYCNDSLNYRVGVYDNGTGFPGTIYWSRWIGARFILPDPLRIKYVSVDTSGIGDTVQVAWYPEVDTLRDFVELRFFPVVPGSLPLATVANRNTGTLELDSTFRGFVGLSASDPNFQAIILNALDTCLNPSERSGEHRVVNVEAVADPCLSKINLSWREYEGWNDLLHYLIYRREDPAGPWQLLDTVTGGSYDDIDTSLELSKTYRYLLVAQNQRGFESLSNTDTALYDVPKPTFSYLESASVDTVSFDKVHIRFNIPQEASIGRLELYRKEGAQGNYRLIDTLSNPTASNGSVGPYWLYAYTDNSARRPQDVVYTYKVLVYDVCYLISDTSNEFSCLQIRAGLPDNYTNVLLWDRLVHYLSYDSLPRERNRGGIVDSFTVYRDVVFTGGLANYTALPLRKTGILPIWKPLYEYGDRVDNLPTDEGLFDYYVVAVEKENPWEFVGRSASNKVRLRQEPRIFAPTGIMGGSAGSNGEFRPAFNYNITDDSSYFLKIVSRWGKVILETKDRNLGWKGYVGENQDESGERALQDTYIYQVQFKGADNNLYKLKGNLTLIWKD